MKPVYLFAAGACALVALNLLPACKSSSGVIARVSKQITTPEDGKPYVVATEKTAFYRYSPKQGNGPDAELPKDTVVKFIRNSFGFSKIQVAATGEQGFVASEDIMRASPALLASLSATPAPEIAAVDTTITPEPAVENLDVRDTDASFVPPPEELPPPDLPPAGGESAPL